MIDLSAHISMLFTEHPFLERAQAAREAGFTVIESWWPPDEAVEFWPERVARAGVRVALVNAYAGRIEAGDRGFLNDPIRRSDAIAAVCTALALVKRVDAQYVNVLVGRRNPARGQRAELAQVVDTLAECAELASVMGATILIEPINEIDVPGYVLPTPRAAARVIDAVGSESLKLLYDVYHAAMAGEDPIACVSSYVGMLGHVQYADAPGRGPPGTGRIDLVRLVERLGAHGYSGAVGLEYEPRGSTTQSLGPLLRSASG
jgi:hydroxypyruvate isomerase